MSGVFSRALEAYDNQSTGGENDKEMIVMKGPLSEMYTQALNKVYAKTEGSPEGVAVESQANDALMMQQLAQDLNNPPGDEENASTTTVYGVSKDSPSNDDFINISKEFEGDDKLVLIIDGVQPGPNSPDDSIPAERAEMLSGALESFVLANGGQVFHSLEEYAASRVSTTGQNPATATTE